MSALTERMTQSQRPSEGIYLRKVHLSDGFAMRQAIPCEHLRGLSSHHMYDAMDHMYDVMDHIYDIHTNGSHGSYHGGHVRQHLSGEGFVEFDHPCPP